MKGGDSRETAEAASEDCLNQKILTEQFRESSVQRKQIERIGNALPRTGMPYMSAGSGIFRLRYSAFFFQRPTL